MAKAWASLNGTRGWSMGSLMCAWMKWHCSWSDTVQGQWNGIQLRKGLLFSKAWNKKTAMAGWWRISLKCFIKEKYGRLWSSMAIGSYYAWWFRRRSFRLHRGMGKVMIIFTSSVFWLPKLRRKWVYRGTSLPLRGSLTRSFPSHVAQWLYFIWVLFGAFGRSGLELQMNYGGTTSCWNCMATTGSTLVRAELNPPTIRTWFGSYETSFQDMVFQKRERRRGP